MRAVTDVSFDVRPGEAVGLVGESGCGKSATALAVMRLLPTAQASVSGRILFEGRDLLACSRPEMRGIRGQALSMIFQNPMTSLNPVFTVGRQISEAVMAHRKVSRRAARGRALELLKAVGIAGAASGSTTIRTSSPEECASER